MRERSAPAGGRRHHVSVDAVLLTARDRELTVLLRRSGARTRERWELPWETLIAGQALAASAARLGKAVLGSAPSHLEQIAAFADGRRHPGGAGVSVAFFGLAPAGSPAPVGGQSAWFPMDELPPLAPRHATIADAARRAVRAQVEAAPIAFRLLPPTFTLTQLQEVYELLLEQQLHKASFRRALLAAHLVEPIDEWRTEGRGRPAQLFRYAPARRKVARGGVRFG